MLVIPATIGLFLGRIANFINGELVGRVTNVPWCVIFPDYDTLCRHPSQLYEAGKNLALFIVLTPLVMANTLKKGTVFAFFLIGYGLLRFTITFLREDTVFLGLSQGQYLSLATALAGIIVYCVIHFRADAQKTPRT